MRRALGRAGVRGASRRAGGHRYRLDVELRAGEKLARAPEATQVNASDLDPDRNFVITAAQ